MSLVLEVVTAAQVTMVVNFAVVDQPEVRIGGNSHGLHPVRSIDDRQPMETETRAGKGRNSFDAECIWSPVGNFHALGAQLFNVFLRTKYCPNTAHGLVYSEFCPEEAAEWKRERANE